MGDRSQGEAVAVLVHGEPRQRRAADGESQGGGLLQRLLGAVVRAVPGRGDPAPEDDYLGGGSAGGRRGGASGGVQLGQCCCRVSDGAGEAVRVEAQPARQSGEGIAGGAAVAGLRGAQQR